MADINSMTREELEQTAHDIAEGSFEHQGEMQEIAEEIFAGTDEDLKKFIEESDWKPDKPEPEPPAVVTFYPHDFSYAEEHGEVDLYRASIKENRRCIPEIEQLIRDTYDGMHLHISEKQWKDLMSSCGEERVTFIMANTIHQAPWDGRYSRSNKEWAEARFDYANMSPRLENFILPSHPVIVNGMVNALRKRRVEEVVQSKKEDSLEAGQAEERTATRKTPGNRPKR